MLPIAKAAARLTPPPEQKTPINGLPFRGGPFCVSGEDQMIEDEVLVLLAASCRAQLDVLQQVIKFVERHREAEELRKENEELKKKMKELEKG
jgi:hypothetical protein